MLSVAWVIYVYIPFYVQDGCMLFLVEFYSKHVRVYKASSLAFSIQNSKMQRKYLFYLLLVLMLLMALHAELCHGKAIPGTRHLYHSSIYFISTRNNLKSKNYLAPVIYNNLKLHVYNIVQMTCTN